MDLTLLVLPCSFYKNMRFFLICARNGFFLICARNGFCLSYDKLLSRFKFVGELVNESLLSIPDILITTLNKEEKTSLVDSDLESTSEVRMRFIHEESKNAYTIRRFHFFEDVP